MLGRTLAHYEVLEKIGAGGMGEVYRARDTKLGRDVALKALPEDFAADEQRLARFQREAQVLASLNHPNIAAIYGAEDNVLVLELVDGPTLAERLAEGPIPLDEALNIARQIVDALEEAHEKGIVHRDLKPANVKLTEDGKVKVLDFGLAKAFSEEAAEVDASQSPTLTRDATRTGVILGTAAYMSPEQARGKVVDKRSDIFSFGVVLYEMLAGRRAFPGEDVSEILAAVIKTEPDMDRLPSHLRRLVDQCLKKDVRERVRDIGDVRIALAEMTNEPLVAAPPPRRVVVWPAVVGVLLTALVMWGLREDAPRPAPVRRATITLPEGQTQPRLLAHPLALSPDGTLLAYVAEDKDGSGLFLRSLDGFETRKLPGTDGADMPFFSPDGEWVGFFAAGKLKKVSVARGSVLTIARASDGMGASWGRDRTIVFTPSQNGGLFRVSEDGGEPEQLTTPDFGEDGYAHVWPQHLPVRQAVLFVIWGGGQRTAALDLSTGDWDVIAEDMGGTSYVRTGHLIFYNQELGSGLLAAPFDADNRTITGPTVQVLSDVRVYASQSGWPYITISPEGTAVYVAKASEVSALAWMDRSGALTPILSQTGSVGTPRLSPDGERIAFHDEQGSIKVLHMEPGTVDTLLSEPGSAAGSAAWHPNGDRLAAQSNRAGSWDIHEVAISARREPTPLLVRDYDQFMTSWSSDGRLLAFFELHPVTGFDLWALPVGEEPQPILATSANEYHGEFSPDGRLLAYVSEESGRAEVYVRDYPEGETHLVSASGGDAPAWSKDGRELFFRSGRKFHAVEITTQPRFRASAPELLHEVPFDRGYPRFPDYYDVAPDGRFLVVEDRSTKEFNVIFNWFEELERLAPTK